MEKHPSVRELADCFLERVRKEGKSPNFFMSREYIQKAGLIWTVEINGLCGWKQEGYEGWFFPPLRNNHFQEGPKVWAGWPEVNLAHFLDEEYIYNPGNFLDLSGNRWKVFRRNVRHWQELTAGWVYRELAGGCGYDPDDPDSGAVGDLLLKWSEGREIYDPDLFASFALFGENRWGLFDTDGALRGVNVADENWEFVNFRYCIDTGEEKLNEYLRFLFYTSPWVLSRMKLVNDGGSLGSEGLAQFKRKLRPVVVRHISTSEE